MMNQDSSVDMANIADQIGQVERGPAAESMHFKNSAMSGFEKTTFNQLNKRHLKKYVKEQKKKLHEKEENPMNLQEGAIFGVKSPAQQIALE